ncbi:MAG: hypothetical protein KH305_11535, partial [Sutterella wadsworthensis]|nr:hypothetical protein [Sutterella wadsworthensis]
TPLHPLLAAVSKENISFDRSDKPNVHKVVVRDAVVGRHDHAEEEVTFSKGPKKAPHLPAKVSGAFSSTG